MNLATLLGCFLKEEIASFETFETTNQQASKEEKVDEPTVRIFRTNLDKLMDAVRTAFPDLQEDIGKFIAGWRAEVTSEPESKLRRYREGET